MDQRERFEDMEARARHAEEKLARLELALTRAHEETRQAREKERQAELRADDHPNKSWGGLYAERDMWRTAFVQAATASTAEGITMLEWRRRAIVAEDGLRKVAKLGGEIIAKTLPDATPALFLPAEMPVRVSELVAIARAQEAEEKRRREGPKAPTSNDPPLPQMRTPGA